MYDLSIEIISENANFGNPNLGANLFVAQQAAKCIRQMEYLCFFSKNPIKKSHKKVCNAKQYVYLDKNYFLYVLLSPMKLFWSLPKMFLVSLLFVGVTTATTGDLRSWMDNLADTVSFGYAANQTISVGEITTGKVMISSPKIKDEVGNDIKSYTLMYSQFPLSDILDNTDLLGQSKEKTFNFPMVSATVSMELSTTDSIDPSKVYYVSVIPKDPTGILWEISNEIWFKMSDMTYGEGKYTAPVHAAAWADMNLANVSHVIAGNKVTLRWTAVNGSDKVDIFLWNPTSEVFSKLATVNMADETYTFTTTRNGEHIINFMPNNSGREKRYTFTISGATGTTWTTVIPKVPHVGATENILVALFIAFVLYLLYRRNVLKNK